MSVKRYLRSFANHTAYNEYINGSDVILPNVSYCTNENEVHYNPSRDYSKEYLTFEAITTGTVTVRYDETATTISYSTDNGTTWTPITTSSSAQVFCSLSVGDKVLLKGTNNYYYLSCIFGGTAQTEIYGNILSMIYGDNFENQTTLPSGQPYGHFEGMFIGYTNLISAKNLILLAVGECSYNSTFQGCTSLETAPTELPATTLATNCYGGMFDSCTSLTTAPVLPATTLASDCYMHMFGGCTSLVSAPELPATTLASGCYNYMFQNCTSLNYIKAMFTTTPSNAYTTDWVSGISSTGTFVKNSAATWNVTGVNGVPSGWTVETASA